MLRKHVIQKYANLSQVDHIIWHDGSTFIKATVQNIWFLLLFFVIYAIIDQYTTLPYLERIFAGLGIIIFARYILSFLNLYLDCIILWPHGITIFQREGLLEYKTDIFKWENIEAVSHNQNSLRDKLRSRWSMYIALDQGIHYPFENISKPKKQVDIILRYQNAYYHNTWDNPHSSTINEPRQDYSILMEALGEVVQEYVNKKKKNEDSHYTNFDE